MSATEALADRRQRAREAYYDRYALGDNIGGSARKAAVRECIETATRVQLTPEVVEAAEQAWLGSAVNFDSSESLVDWRKRRVKLMVREALTAAGFEIEE